MSTGIISGFFPGFLPEDPQEQQEEQFSFQEQQQQQRQTKDEKQLDFFSEEEFDRLSDSLAARLAEDGAPNG